MAKGVWVKADVIEAKLTVHPIATLERPAYNQFLGKHFSCLDDGFFFRATNERYNTCSCTEVASAGSRSITYEVYSPLANLLFTGTLLDPEITSHSMTSSIDSDSEVEEVADNLSILLTDHKNKCLIRISYGRGTFHKNQVTRVESPPGVLLGWIRRYRRCLAPNLYQLYEGSEPIVPNMVLTKCNPSAVTDDDESHDIGCFSCFLPCCNSSLKTTIFEVQNVVEAGDKAEALPSTANAIGMIFGSHQGQVMAKIGRDDKITCSFNSGISYRKKVLILTAVIVVHLNRDIA